MRLTVPLFLLALSGCPPQAPQPQPLATKTERFFDEKVRCATVGERWEARICGAGAKLNPLCVGWWAYNRERDTCVGVYVTTVLVEKDKREQLLVADLLTGEELEQYCYAANCDSDSAKRRWILGDKTP
jgi:hypothetical protein